MRFAAALASLALIAGRAAAAAAPGWTRQPTALLLYGGDGALMLEIPLPEPDHSGDTTREIRGGASPDGRLAWTLERRLVWTPGRTEMRGSHRMFRIYGTSGAALWWDSTVDIPERGEPARFSNDGRILLLARRDKDGWRADARTWLGQTIVSLGPFPRLIAMELTANGRYALARWNVPDVSDTHTFIDLQAKARRDVASADLVLGAARIGDDGVVRSGSKIVLAFEVAVSPPAAAAAGVQASTAPASK